MEKSPAAAAAVAASASASELELEKQWAVFDQAGNLACAPVVRQNPQSLTVAGEAKIPRRRVWMLAERDCKPLMPEVHLAAAQMDAETLWRAAGGESFSIGELAEKAGAKNLTETLAMLHTVLANPAYFHRGDARFVPAPESALSKVRASLQRRAEALAAEREILAELAAGKTPSLLTEHAADILAGRCKNSPPYRAVKKAAGGDRDLPEFLVKVGVLAGPRECWQTIFSSEWPPRPSSPEAPLLPSSAPPSADSADAFSIDDIGTFEVDDAFSVTPQENGGFRIGVHIAVPALDDGLFAEEALRDFGEGGRRLISVYFPGEKHPMLSQAHIDSYSLRAGSRRPSLSLYCSFNSETGEIGDMETKLETVAVAHNFTPEEFDDGAPEAVREAYETLADFTGHLDPSPPWNKTEYRIVPGDPPQIFPAERRPVASVVEKLMRHVNGAWGRRLAKKRQGGLFRASGMTGLRPEKDNPYAWMSSPLRRAADLFNQRLLLTQSGRAEPLLRVQWRELASAFSSAQTRARRHQDTMERHWALKALQALPEGTALAGQAQKKNKIRLRDYPLSGKIVYGPVANVAAAGADVQVCLQDINFFTQQAQFVRI